MSKPTGSHGLFNAMGKKSKPVHIYDEDGNIIKVDKRPRQDDDFEPTPPEPTRAFCKAEMARIMQFNYILEPAAGDGRMARDLHDCTGLEVSMVDLVDRGCGALIRSFYDRMGLRDDCCIITNPPFDQCQGEAIWVRHALEVLNTDYLALLLPATWLGAANKQSIWNDHQPSRIYLMRWRIDFTGKGANPSLHAWYVWDRTHVGETLFRVLDKYDDPRQGNLI